MVRLIFLIIFILLLAGGARAQDGAGGPALLMLTEEYPPMNYLGPDGRITGRATRLVRLAGGARAQDGAGGPALLMLTEEYPPMNYLGPDGRITGRATRLVRLAGERAGITLSFRLLPWKRAYHMALTGEGNCVYSTWRTPEREQFFKWVGPLAVDAWSFFARSDGAPEIQGLADTFAHSVGAVEGWALTEYLDQQGHPNLDKVAKDDKTNLRKLLLGRIELWATGRLIARELLEGREDISVREVFSLREVDLSVACNKTVPDAVIARLQTADCRLHWMKWGRNNSNDARALIRGWIPHKATFHADGRAAV